MKIHALDRAVLGAKFIADMTKNNGKFNYEFDISSGKKFKKYNILRHSGCIYAMSEILPSMDLPKEKKKVVKSIERSINFLIRKRIMQLGKNLVVLDNKEMVKLGANAITIMALENNSASLTKSPMVLAERLETSFLLAEYLKTCLKEDGKLSPHKFNFNTKKPESFNSDFYPGEVMLAFCMLAKYHKKDECLSIAIKIMHWLRNNRDKHIQTRDHWQLQAMEMLYYMVNKHEKKFIGDYAERIAKVEPITPSRFLSVPGGPIAARTEGLLAYYSMFKKKWALEEINKNIKRLAEFQIIKGPYAGCFLYEIGKSITRIDHSQHGSLAFLKYAKIVKNIKI